MDLYKPLLARNKPDEHLVRVGRWSGFVILLVATVLAIWLSYRQLGIFEAVQKIGMWVAAPVARERSKSLRLSGSVRTA